MRIDRSLFLVPVIGLFSCGESTTAPSATSVAEQLPAMVSDLSGSVVDTNYTVSYVDAFHRDLKPAIDSLIRSLNASLSMSDPTSAIARFNANPSKDEVIMDEALLEAYKYGVEVWMRTDHAYDPAFTSASDERSTADLQKLRLDASTGSPRLIRLAPGVLFLPGRMLQGLAADRLAGLLEAKGVADYLVRVGGSMRVRGVRADRSEWDLGLIAASDSMPMPRTDAMKAGGLTVSTCKVKHTKDVSPTDHVFLRSATVMHENGRVAAGVAQALCAMGFERARSWLLGQPTVMALLVVSDANDGARTVASVAWPGMNSARATDTLMDTSAKAAQPAK